MEPFRFPHQTGAPQRLLFFTVDQVIVFSVFVGLGLITGHVIKLLILSVFMSHLLTRYRDSRPEGFFLHVLYRYGLVSLKGRCFLNPFVRRVLP